MVLKHMDILLLLRSLTLLYAWLSDDMLLNMFIRATYTMVYTNRTDQHLQRLITEWHQAKLVQMQVLAGED